MTLFVRAEARVGGCTFSRLLDAREKRARRTMLTNEGVMSARGWRVRAPVAPGAASGND